MIRSRHILIALLLAPSVSLAQLEDLLDPTQPPSPTSVPSLDRGSEEESEPREAAKPRPIELTGWLETGVVAIGAETTGIRLVTDTGKSYEISMDPLSSAKFNGKKVHIKGEIAAHEALEIPIRYIVRVGKIEEAD